VFNPIHGNGSPIPEHGIITRPTQKPPSQQVDAVSEVPLASERWDLSSEWSFYEIAIQELRSGTYVVFLWDRAYTHARGDLRKATSLYLNLRVLELSTNREPTAA
jgi:hypothetical protein